MVLYYKASHRDLDDLTKEGKKEDTEDENKEEIKEESKESWDELVSEPPDPTEIKSVEGEEGLEDSQDQEEKEEDDSSSPEASEENNPLKISESRKVTAAKGWIKWEAGPWAQAPQCSGRPSPRMDFCGWRGQRALRHSPRGRQKWSQVWREWSLCGKWQT